MVCYNTSRDYKRLKDLLDAGKEIVCFCTYDWGDGEYVTDICCARYDYGTYHISARGIEYVRYRSGSYRYKSFEDACEANNVEFIEPTK